MVNSWLKVIGGMGVGNAVASWFVPTMVERSKKAPEAYLLYFGALYYLYPYVSPYGEFVGMMGAAAGLTAAMPFYLQLRGV
jgi:hypothetical protein